jgi:poly-gamma-glutamate synthesis protein (capsule biosynthesis protein)
LAIDAGADLVIGNHPHWIQPVELYNGKLITYAHGNFVFDQEWSLETKQGVVGRYTFYDTQLVDVEFLPVLIENYGQPHFLMGAEKQFILDHMYSESQILEKQPVVYLSS